MGHGEGFESLAARLRSSAADLAFGEPFVNGGAGKSRQSAGQFQVRQAAHQEVVNRADRNAEAGGELLLVFVVRRWRLACAGDGLQMFTHALLLPQVREGWGTTGTLRNKKGPKAANTDCAKCPANYLRYVTDWVLLGVSV